MARVFSNASFSMHFSMRDMQHSTRDVQHPGDIVRCPCLQLGLSTPTDEIPGDFFESLEIPGDLRFLFNKRASKNKFLVVVLIFGSFPRFDEAEPLDI